MEVCLTPLKPIQDPSLIPPFQLHGGRPPPERVPRARREVDLVARDARREEQKGKKYEPHLNDLCKTMTPF